MARTVNAGARLDRLPISSFHRRVFWLIGAGMFFDGYDLYVGTTVLGSTIASGFSTLQQNAQFVSLTFLGMTIGSFVTGFLGDHYGRRFTYQFNLMIFGLASLAAAFAPDMTTLNLLRFVMGLGLGAEIVVGYGTMTEFVPPAKRGRWLATMALIVVSGLPATALLGTLIIPNFGWRPMFVIAGVGALIVWYLRKSLPESPRWLEANGRTEEAEALMQQIEKEAVSACPRRKRPSTTEISAGSQRRSAAIRSKNRRRISAHARRIDAPETSMDRLPAVYHSFGARSLSPETTRKRSGLTSSSSAAICVSAVTIPCPSSTLPTMRRTRRSGSNAIQLSSRGFSARLRGSGFALMGCPASPPRRGRRRG